VARSAEAQKRFCNAAQVSRVVRARRAVERLRCTRVAMAGARRSDALD
jgi:L-fucose isomerase-like protein